MWDRLLTRTVIELQQFMDTIRSKERAFYIQNISFAEFCQGFYKAQEMNKNPESGYMGEKSLIRYR